MRKDSGVHRVFEDMVNTGIWSIATPITYCALEPFNQAEMAR